MIEAEDLSSRMEADHFDLVVIRNEVRIGTTVHHFEVQLDRCGYTKHLQIAAQDARRGRQHHHLVRGKRDLRELLDI